MLIKNKAEPTATSPEGFNEAQISSILGGSRFWRISIGILYRGANLWPFYERQIAQATPHSDAWRGGIVRARARPRPLRASTRLRSQASLAEAVSGRFLLESYTKAQIYGRFMKDK